LNQGFAGPVVDAAVSAHLVDDEHDQVGDHDAEQDHEDGDGSLGKTTDRQIVVLVVLVEVLLVKIWQVRRLIENNTMRDQTRLKRIVEIRNKPEIVYRHERYQLQVLEEDPHWK